MAVSGSTERTAKTMDETFFDSQGAGVFITDTATGGIVEANTTALQMLEMPAAAVIGKLCSIFLKATQNKPLLPSDEAVHGNLTIYHGRMIPVIISTAVCSLGKQKGIIHSFIRLPKIIEEEITAKAHEDERKDDAKGINSLLYSERNFKMITESIQDAIIMMNDKKNISFVNSAACTMFGYTEDEMLGKDLHRLIAPKEYFDSFTRGYETFQQTGEGVVVGRTLEIEALRKNGKVFPVELSISATKLENKWHATGVIRDITERRDAENRIIEASEAAENASRTKSEFLANMSHEIRTPLNSIIGTTELMADTELNDEQRKYIEIMHSSGNSLLALVNDILDISRIEAGKIVLETIPFNIRDTLRKVIDTFKLRAEKKELTLSCEIRDDVPECLEGDPNRLMQIVVNLLGNSIKFTESGGIKVFVQKIGTPDGKSLIKFSVVDSGIGIPASKLESIFNSFTQADTSVTRQFGGTGLGLTISKKLVHLMNGIISVDSQIDQGSTFSFTAEFGVHNRSGVEEETETASKEQTRTAEKTLRNLRILLVDDSPDNRFLVKAFLRKEPCLVAEAENGSEAVEKFLQKYWDIILMDMQMPVMDGYTATKRIREIEQENGLEHTPIVALTAHSISTEIKKCLDAGCDIHLAKPVSKSALIGLIAELTGELESDNDKHNDTADSPESDGDRIRVVVDHELMDLIPGYIAHRQEDIEILRSLLKKREFRDIERCGHSMKGSGAGYGFTEITKIGAFLEKAGKSQSIRKIEEGIDKLEDYLENLEIV